MRRVVLDEADGDQDSLLFHLSRYKFISRLVEPTDRVLEIGCGTGYGARFLSDHVQLMVASDLDEAILEYARTRFHNANLVFTNELDGFGKFDVVVCLEVIEHLEKDDGVELLQDIRSYLRDGGVAFISTPRKLEDPSENRRRFHCHEYEFEEFKTVLKSTFGRVLLFTQIDEIISTHHPTCAWTLVACCFQ